MPDPLWQNRRTRRVYALPVIAATATALLVCSVTSLRAQSTVGIYRDLNGSNCTLTDASAGLINAYVIVRPDENGVTGLQFAAPVPACFNGVYLADESAPSTLVIGNSQTGVSVALLGCRGLPTHVLTIQYTGTGTTPVCCEYPVIPDPFLSTIDIVDCAYNTHTGAGLISRFNADASCPCFGNTPPSPPLAPTPTNGATNVSVLQTLSWYASDVDDNITGYDVYLGTDIEPPLIASDVPTPAYDPGQLTPLATHYWRVVVRDAAGAEAAGPLWAFTTRDVNSPPVLVGAPIPASGAFGVGLNVVLQWGASDVDGDELEYDLYFGTTTVPPLVASSLASPNFAPGSITPLDYNTLYYWSVVVRDSAGNETTGPVWSFTTRLSNYPPNVPGSPSPANGATNRPVTSTLSWQCTDPDGDALTYDVYFGMGELPPLVATNHPTNSFNPGPLLYSTLYRWRIVARDGPGHETSGPEWTFTTRINSPPAVPSSPSPANNTVDRSPASTLSWACSDPDGNTITYDVYFGTTSPPPLVASDVTTKSYDPGGPLALLTKYYWRIVARDELGAETGGPDWNFTTWAADLPPNPPSNPSPPHDGVASVTPTLRWTASDPAGQPLTFDVYFGTTESPPLVAAGLTTNSYTPGTLQLNTYYHWRVVASDGTHSTSGPTWAFYAVTASGGLNTVGIYSDPIGFGCSLTDPALVPVNAYIVLTPGPGGATGLQFSAPVPPCYTGLFLGETVPVGFLSIGNTQSDLSVALGGCLTQPTVVVTMQFFGYGTTPPCCEYPVLPAAGKANIIVVDCGFVELAATGRTAVVNPNGTCPCEVSVPVLISSFEAKARGGGVDVRWELSGDETAERFTLQRRTDAETASSVRSQGSVTGTTGSFYDDTVAPATTYHYELVVRTAAGDEFRSPVATLTTPSLSLALGQNHPNPFNPQTAIPYTLPGGSTRVRLFILDVSGRVVRTLVNETQSAGPHEAVWDGRDDRGGSVSSGVYFCVLDADGARQSRKLVLLK